MSNTTTTAARTFNVLTANVPTAEQDHPHFSANTVLAFTSSNWQIDDLIGWTHNDAAVNGTSPYNFYHWTQWSTSNTPATGNVLSTWVSYIGADWTVADGTSNLNIQSTATFTSPTVANTVISRTAGTQNLGSLGNVTSSNIKGNKTVSLLESAVSSSWTAQTNTTWARLNLAVSGSFSSDPVLKIGDTVSYVSGWRWFATNTATIAASQGQSTVQTYTIVENAVALTVSSVAAILALSF